MRFAPTSSDAQLALAGRLLAAHPGTYLQTHVAENRDELAWVAELFPDARSYLDVYARHGLIGPRSVLAHGVWFDADDRALLGRAGAQIAHCPSSNLFLGSGLADWRALEDAGAAVSLASDVGGGTSLSMLRTMADAYKVQALRGCSASGMEGFACGDTRRGRCARTRARDRFARCRLHGGSGALAVRRRAGGDGARRGGIFLA